VTVPVGKLGMCGSPMGKNGPLTSGGRLGDGRRVSCGRAPKGPEM
jgi:hypothetical protein